MERELDIGHYCTYTEKTTWNQCPSKLKACHSLASIPGRLNKAAWYTLYAHACTLPQKGVIRVFVDTVEPRLSGHLGSRSRPDKWICRIIE